MADNAPLTLDKLKSKIHLEIDTTMTLKNMCIKYMK